MKIDPTTHHAGLRPAPLETLSGSADPATGRTHAPRVSRGAGRSPACVVGSPPQKRILICGGRHFYDFKRIKRILSMFQRPDLVITGGASGADFGGHQAAKALGIPTQVFRADWETYGKSAGGIRNQQMLDEGKPNLVLAFPSKDSKGTWDMVRRAKKAGIEVIVYE